MSFPHIYRSIAQGRLFCFLPLPPSAVSLRVALHVHALEPQPQLPQPCAAHRRCVFGLLTDITDAVSKSFEEFPVKSHLHKFYIHLLGLEMFRGGIETYSLPYSVSLTEKRLLTLRPLNTTQDRRNVLLDNRVGNNEIISTNAWLLSFFSFNQVPPAVLSVVLCGSRSC